MSKKCKIAVSCLSFVICLFVVISVGSPRKASAYDGFHPANNIYYEFQPLLPFSYSSITLPDRDNDRYIELIPTDYLCKFVDDTTTGSNAFSNRSILFANEFIIPYAYYGYNLGTYKKALWTSSFFPDYISVEQWFYGSTPFLIPAPMNAVGYYTIDNLSDYELNIEVDYTLRWFSNTAGELMHYGGRNEYDVSPSSQVDIYSPIKSVLIDIYDNHSINVVLVYDIHLSISCSELTTAQVDLIDLYFNYPVFKMDDYNGFVVDLIEGGGEPQYIYEINWFEQITEDINDFMSLEILPYISFYDILILAIVIPLLIAILKIWLGG